MTLREYDHLRRDIVLAVGNARHGVPIKLLLYRDLYQELRTAFDVIKYPDDIKQYFMGYIIELVDIPGYRWFVCCGDGGFHETL